MGMGASPSGGNNSKRLMAEINVTPMVDVMLVLLVIFMITAPVIKQIEGIQANLPQLKDGASQTIVTEDARTVVIAADGTVSRAEAGKDPSNAYVDLSQLTTDLSRYKDDSDQGKKTPVVVIAADRETRWERVMQVWNCVKAAGIAQVSFQVADR